MLETGTESALACATSMGIETGPQWLDRGKRY